MSNSPPEQVRLVFADTGNEHELTYRYLQEYLPEALGMKIDTVRADFTTEIERKRGKLARLAVGGK